MQKLLPTHHEWAKRVAGGFKPNGSTWSPDHLYHKRIGKSDSSYRWAHLPANRHDYRYDVGGGYRDRSFADWEFWRGLRKSVSDLTYPWKATANFWCLIYFLAVRLFGWTNVSRQ